MYKQINGVLPLVFFFLLLKTSLCQTNNTFTDKVALLMGDSALAQAMIAVEIRDVETNKSVVSINANKSMIPASIQKLLTTGVALEILDSSYKFVTSIGYRGDIDSCGVLRGDLIVNGGGDPTLGSMFFSNGRPRMSFIYDWINYVKTSGITAIDGCIIINATHYDNWPVVDTWTYEDLGNYYGAGIYSLTMFDNICELHFASPAKNGMKTTFKHSWPQLNNLVLVNHVVSGPGGDNAYVFQSPTSNKMIVRGSITANSDDFVVKACIPDPPEVFASLFSKALDSIGIRQFSAPIVVTDGEEIPDGEFCELFVHYSPIVKRIAEQTNFHSVNLFAEHLLRETGWCWSGVGSTEEGTRALHDFFKKKQISTIGVQIVDGSGLSRFNLVTASFMVEMLVYFKKQSPYSSVFYNSLPRAGQTGTMDNFGKKSTLVGKVRAKTGSMTRVKNLAGYIETRSGKILAFTIMANNYSCGGARIKQFQESILKTLYEY